MTKMLTSGPPPVVSTRAWVEQIMGMPISVHVRALDTRRADISDAVRRVFDHLRRADAVFSTWNADSQLMRLRSGRLHVTDADLWIDEVEQHCRTATHVTDGLFTTDLVGLDGTRGWDPTGLVKGWAVGAAADHLRALNAIAFSINAGGDIVCGLGQRSTALATPWRIGIQDPLRPDTIARVVEIIVGALATSSTSARGDHIIDPRTGAPVRRQSSSTVVGPDLMWADVWATVTFIDPDALSNHPQWDAYATTIVQPTTHRETT